MKNPKVIWGIQNSNFYAKEMLPDNEDDQEYFDGDVWIDCDVIKIGDNSYQFITTKEDEIIVRDDEPDELVEKILLHYFSKDWDDKSISPDFDNDDWTARLTN